MQNLLQQEVHVLAIFLYFDKAYDMVWRRGLLFSIEKGIMRHILAYIANILYNTTSKVKLSRLLSRIYDLINGVLQGSSLLPLLFQS